MKKILFVLVLINSALYAQSFSSISGFVRKDTIWYGDNPNDYWTHNVYESKYLVKDATVTISDGTNNYVFSYVNFEHDYYWDE